MGNYVSEVDGTIVRKAIREVQLRLREPGSPLRREFEKQVIRSAVGRDNCLRGKWENHDRGKWRCRRVVLGSQRVRRGLKPAR